jgi:hypothetical protein
MTYICVEWSFKFGCESEAVVNCGVNVVENVECCNHVTLEGLLLYPKRNECNGARLGQVLCASHPMVPTMCWYLHLHSRNPGDSPSLSDWGQRVNR